MGDGRGKPLPLLLVGVRVPRSLYAPGPSGRFCRVPGGPYKVKSTVISLPIKSWMATGASEHATRAIHAFSEAFALKYPKVVAKVVGRRRGVPRVLRFSRRALGAPQHHQPHRVNLRHGTAAHEGNQGARQPGRRARHGLQACRVRPGPVAGGQRSASRRPRPSRGQVEKGGDDRRLKPAGSRGRRVAGQILDPQVLTISPRNARRESGGRLRHGGAGGWRGQLEGPTLDKARESLRTPSVPCITSMFSRLYFLTVVRERAWLHSERVDVPLETFKGWAANVNKDRPL
jgi:hypothetical protein